MLFTNLDCLAGHGLAFYGIDQHGFEPGAQILWVLQLFASVRLSQELNDIRKISGVGSEAGRDSVRTWFNHVLPAPVTETTAHKTDVS